MPTHIEIADPEGESERAPLAKPGDLVVASPRACAVCGTALTGRPQQQCCSARCRAAKSRRQQAERDRRVRELLEVAVRTLGEPT